MWRVGEGVCVFQSSVKRRRCRAIIDPIEDAVSIIYIYLTSTFLIFIIYILFHSAIFIFLHCRGVCCLFVCLFTLPSRIMKRKTNILLKHSELIVLRGYVYFCF